MSLEHSPGRKTHGGATTDRAAYTVAEFCDAHRFSRSKLYQLWAAGAGPRFMQIGAKRIITVEAAADFRRDLEVASHIGGDDDSTASEGAS
jgi:hypothetical protein